MILYETENCTQDTKTVREKNDHSRQEVCSHKESISYSSICKTQIMSSFKVWVKELANVEEDAFEVDCYKDMKRLSAPAHINHP